MVQIRNAIYNKARQNLNETMVQRFLNNPTEFIKLIMKSQMVVQIISHSNNVRTYVRTYVGTEFVKNDMTALSCTMYWNSSVN